MKTIDTVRKEGARRIVWTDELDERSQFSVPQMVEKVLRQEFGPDAKISCSYDQATRTHAMFVEEEVQ